MKQKKKMTSTGFLLLNGNFKGALHVRADIPGEI